MNVNHHPIWDQDALLGRMRGRSDRVVKLVNLFLDDIPDRIQALAHGVTEQNAEACAMHAHTVKGVAANLSVLRLEELARTVEEAAKAQHLDQVAALMDDINRVYEQSEDELKRFVEAHA